MKCQKCGKEIESGLLYCPFCGESIQLVPEYDVFEEELLSRVVEDKDKAKSDKFNNGVYNDIDTDSMPAIDIKVTGSKSKEIQISRGKLGVILGFFLTLILSIIFVIVYFNSTHTFDYRMKLAYEAEADEQYKKALEYYSEALSIDSSSFDALYGQGRMYYELKDYSDAITKFNMALTLDPENTQVYTYLLDSYQYIGDYDSINNLAASAPNDEILDLISEYTVLPPSFSLDGGEYHSKITLYLIESNGYDIYYTTNGKNPTTSGKLYKGSIELEEGETTVKAVCQKNNNEYSQVVSETYNITYDEMVVPTPEVTPASGIYYEPTLITIHVPSGYSAYYTWDGSDPSLGGGIRYSQPFYVLDGASVLWVVLKDSKGEYSQAPYVANYVYIKE
ncbi:MAG: chitobiase/beta-hexosaminidase C-terminal domain-containing protein [Pseudobutyrivibrio sp.]|nr:chitobiase/beta-hexosaminidase C-terminal domain-containing protein [Pseudobutyrivibrio sp.]